MLRDIRDLTADPEAYAAELRRRWGSPFTLKNLTLRNRIVSTSHEPRRSSLRRVSSGSAAVTRTSLCEWCCNLLRSRRDRARWRAKHLQGGPRFMVCCSVPAGMCTSPGCASMASAAAEPGSWLRLR